LQLRKFNDKPTFLCRYKLNSWTFENRSPNQQVAIKIIYYLCIQRFEIIVAFRNVPLVLFNRLQIIVVKHEQYCSINSVRNPPSTTAVCGRRPRNRWRKTSSSGASQERSRCRRSCSARFSQTNISH
jgi:hypothetical protein